MPCSAKGLGQAFFKPVEVVEVHVHVSLASWLDADNVRVFTG